MQLCGVSGSLTEYIIETFCLFLYIYIYIYECDVPPHRRVRRALLFTYGAKESLNKYLEGLRYFLCIEVVVCLIFIYVVH